MGRIIEIGGAGVLIYVDMTLARPLVEELRNELVVREPAARTLFPEIEPLDYATAVTVALARIEKGAVETIWSDALSLPVRRICHWFT